MPVRTQILKGIPALSFNAATISAPLTGTTFALPSTAGALQWQTFFGTAPASVTVDLEMSQDDINWDAVDSSTVVAGEIRTFSNIGGKFIRAKVSAVSGGTTVSVSILCDRSN